MENCCGCTPVSLDFRWSSIGRLVSYFSIYVGAPLTDAAAIFSAAFFGYDILEQSNVGMQPGEYYTSAVPPDPGNSPPNNVAWTWTMGYHGAGRVITSSGAPPDFYPGVSTATAFVGAPPGFAYYFQNASIDPGSGPTSGSWGASSGAPPSQGDWTLSGATPIASIFGGMSSDVMGVSWPLDWTNSPFYKGYNDYTGGTANPSGSWDGSLVDAAPAATPFTVFSVAPASGWSLGLEGAAANMAIYRGQIRYLGTVPVGYQIGRYRSGFNAPDGHYKYQIDLVSSGTLTPVGGVAYLEIPQPPTTPFGPATIGTGAAKGAVQDDFYFIVVGTIGSTFGGVGFHSV